MKNILKSFSRITGPEKLEFTLKRFDIVKKQID
jgi:hypothetical protein